MQNILHILKTTGISQELLAGYIGLPRQTLMKAGNGFTSLKAAALIKLSRLQNCIESAAGNEQLHRLSIIKTERDEELEMTCRYRATVLKRKLDKYERAHKKYMQFLQALELFQPGDEEETLWKQKARNNIIKKLDKCSVATCMRLRKQVYLLEAEADYINRFVNENILSMKTINKIDKIKN